MLQAQGDRALTPAMLSGDTCSASYLSPATGFTVTATLSNLWLPIKSKTHTSILQGDRDFHKAFASQ